MKKNLRIVSAAAAALLAVAPVATSVVSSPVQAATSGTQINANGTVVANPGAAAQQNHYSITLGSNLTVKNNQKVSDFTTEAAVKKALSLPSGVNIAGFGETISATTEPNGGSKVESFTTNNGAVSAYINASITLSGLERNKTYTINGKTVQTNQDGVTKSFVVSIPVIVFDANDTTKPYFINSNSRVQVSENGTVATTIAIKKNDTLASIASNAEGTVTLSSGSTLITQNSDIKAELQKQGVNFNSSDVVTSVPSKTLTITLTARNNNSGLTSTVKVNANANANQYSNYPIIYYRATTNTAWNWSNADAFAVKQGENTLHSAPTIVVNQGSGQFQPTDYFKASIGGENNAWTNDFTVTANDVDASKVGVYHVTVSAKNNAGNTTTLTVPVVITDANGKIDTIKNTVGFPVTVYSVYGDTVVKSANNYDNLYNGTPVHVFETKTINGKEYTRIQSLTGANENDKNAWVESDKLASFKEESTDKTVMHKAQYYAKDGVTKTTVDGKSTAASYSTLAVVPKTVTINGKAYYKVANKNAYVKASNIDGTKRTLKHNAYVYATSKKRATKEVLKKGTTVTTYGGSYKFKNGKRYYRIEGATATNKRYVKVANF